MSWTFWGELFLRSAFLLAAIEGVRQLSKSMPARYRHLVVLTGFGLLAALPILSFVLPPIHLPLFFTTGTDAHVTVTTSMGNASEISTQHASSSAMDWPLLLWLSGTVVMLLPAITGRLLLIRAMRNARPLRDPTWLNSLHELARQFGMRRTPRLLVMQGSVMPLAFGLFRPAILLPEECLQWTEMRKRVVLVHELTHIRRRDGLWQLFANVLAALWWFQPLAWLARKRLRQESEHACDAEVLATGVRASDYATQLVDIARANRLGLLSRAAICMARKDELEPRLVRILAPQAHTGSLVRALVSAALVIAITATAPAITLQKNDSNLGGSHMKRTWLAGLLASATLSAATISGSLFDTTGVAIPDAKLVLHSADTSADLDATSTADGKFSFSDLAAGQYILHIEKPGFTDLLREFTVKADSNIERGLVMQVKGSHEYRGETYEYQPKSGDESAQQKEANENSPSQMAQPFAPNRIRVKGEVAEANLIRKVQPVYPAAAKAAHVQGTVLLQMVILKDGTPGEITVTSSPSNDLSQASIDAVRQWRYRPILLNGQPVEVVTQVIVNYTLSQ